MAEPPAASLAPSSSAAAGTAHWIGRPWQIASHECECKHKTTKKIQSRLERTTSGAASAGTAARRGEYWNGVSQVCGERWTYAKGR